MIGLIFCEIGSSLIVEGVVACILLQVAGMYNTVEYLRGSYRWGE